jgi:prepilin-type processing-associated H-X9-DG protein
LKDLYPLFSIAMNSQFIEWPHAPAATLSEQQSPHTVSFLDNLLDGEPRLVNEQSADNLGQPSASANRFSGLRHGRGGNLGFIDGRVEWRRGDKVIQTEGPSRGNKIRPQIDPVWDLHE